MKTCVHTQKICTQMFSAVLYDSLKLETIWMFFSRWVIKLTGAMKYYSAIKMDKYWQMQLQLLQEIIVSGEKKIPKDLILYVSVYIQFLSWKNCRNGKDQLLGVEQMKGGSWGSGYASERITRGVFVVNLGSGPYFASISMLNYNFVRFTTGENG